MIRRTLNKSSGFNLVELSIVLGIIGLVVGGIWAAAAGANESAKQNMLLSQLQQSVQNIRQIYQRIGVFVPGGAGFPINKTDALDTQEAFPLEMRVAGGLGNLGHPWSAVSSVFAYACNTTSFCLRFTRIPQKSCVAVAYRSFNMATPGFEGMSINQGLISPTNPPTFTVANPLTNALAINGCNIANTAAGAGRNVIEWQFRLR